MNRSLWRTNPSLVFGIAITLLVIALALVGPLLAQHDPMATSAVVHVGDNWIRPPFRALTVPGYPLGSDRFGRDLLSRLLWGMRPTLLLVSVVALVRLALGVVIGIASGWMIGPWGRLFKGLTGAALAVPVLLVGLAVNAAFNVRLGLWAFVLGLVLTGWAESARLVREQTLLIQGQPYIEAARALGASSFQIVVRHVVAQIAPLIWMLWAIEISGTLLLTAELGFLGYYIGGGTWVQVGDWTAANITGFPELGQMLATSYGLMLLQPESMVAAGTVIFVTILGFNLLGEGLRKQLSLEHLRHEPVYGKFVDRVNEGLERWLGSGAMAWLRQNGSLLAGAALVVGVVAAAGMWWVSEMTPTGPAHTSLAVPGEHLWAMERHDVQGSLWSDVPSPDSADVAWSFKPTSGRFAGGPVIARDGTVYIGDTAGRLYALLPNGTVKWTIDTGIPLLGSPALGPYGDIYVTDETGRLSVYQPDQLLLWRFAPPDVATSGPIVASDGTVYYTQGSAVQAVSRDGQPLWRGKIKQYLYTAPRLSADGSLLLMTNIAFRTKDGSSFVLQLGARDASEVIDPRHIIGGDGQPYYFFGHVLIPWQMSNEGVTASSPLTWNSEGQELQLPVDAGGTGEGVGWLFYSNGYSMQRIVWMRAADGQMLGNRRFIQPDSRLVAMGSGGTAYVCGGRTRQETTCLAYQPGVDEPVWQATLSKNGPVTGGALVPGRLYVTTDSGILFAVGQAAAAAPASGAGERTPAPTWTLPFPTQTLTPAP